MIEILRGDAHFTNRELFFQGLPILLLPVDFVDSGHVNANYFLDVDVTGVTYAGAFDVKIADMSLSSVTTGFDQDQLLIQV